MGPWPVPVVVAVIGFPAIVNTPNLLPIAVNTSASVITFGCAVNPIPAAGAGAGGIIDGCGLGYILSMYLATAAR